MKSSPESGRETLGVLGVAEIAGTLRMQRVPWVVESPSLEGRKSS